MVVLSDAHNKKQRRATELKEDMNQVELNTIQRSKHIF